jgi:hypothetical protein
LEEEFLESLVVVTEVVLCGQRANDSDHGGFGVDHGGG